MSHSATLTQALAGILSSHDKQKGDVSYRAEGTLQAIAALAKSGDLAENDVAVLRDAVVACCKHYNQTEVTRKDKQHWPTNHYALDALEALGVQAPA